MTISSRARKNQILRDILPCESLKPKWYKRWHVIEAELKQHIRLGVEKPALLELGIRDAKVPRHILKKVPTTRYTGIDAFADVESEVDRGRTREDANRQVMRNRELAYECSRGWPSQMNIIEGYTNQVHSHVKKMFDVVFIDADHSYEAVREDIVNYVDKLKYTGVLIGHDYRWPDVYRAVHKCFDSVESHADNVWLVRNVFESKLF